MSLKHEIEIEEKIRRLDAAMAQEGMPLSEELKRKLYQCFKGQTSIEDERKKTLMKYKKFDFGGKKRVR